jgi:hypothetical protein
MFTGNPVDTSRERSDHRNKAVAHSVLAVFFQRNLILGYHCRGRGINISGVDFWHAVEFSRNGRFLCTHPRDSLRLSSGRFPSVLRFRLYQTVSGSDFLGAFQVPASAFPFPAVPTLSDPFGADSPSEGGCLPGCWAVPTSETLADSLAPKPIGAASFRTRIPHFANTHANDTTTDESTARRGVVGTCGMAVRGPTGVGAHVGQLGEHYVAAPGVSTQVPVPPWRRSLPLMTTRTCSTQLWWSA